MGSVRQVVGGLTMRDFLFPKRLRRLAYFIRAVPLNIAILLGTPDGEHLSRASGADFAIFVGVLLLLAYGVFFIYLPRIRDTGLPTWILVFGFIPYISNVLGFVLLFGPSKSAIWTQESAESDALPATIPGSVCAECGKSLVLVTDGVIVPTNKILCYDCYQTLKASA